MRYIITMIAAFALAASASAERFVYWEYPNISIPPSDSIGVFDTLTIPDTVIIEDLNVYLGIPTHRAAFLLRISIESPWNETVYMVNLNNNREYLNIWFDTEDVEDGPGQLEDFNGHSSAGRWILNGSQPYGQSAYYPIQSWAIEIITQSAGIETDDNGPREFGIISTYPNPFNDRVEIQFALTEAGRTSIDIYDIRGSKVASLLDADLQPAIHTVTWNAEGMASGVYYYMLKSSGKTAYGHVTLLK
jgi:hypothetical protein